MLTGRGALALAVAGLLVLVGATYGVEEFVLLALVVAVMVVIGALVVTGQWMVLHHRIVIELQPPGPEIPVGRAASLDVMVRGWERALAPVGVQGQGRWSVSYPGLHPRLAAAGERAVSRRRRRTTWRARLARAGSRFAVPSVAPRPRRRSDAWVASVPVPTTVRGVWTLEPLAMWCIDPLGLVGCKIAHSPPAHVIVSPDPGPVAAALLGGAMQPGHTELALAALSASRRAGDELAGLRPYVAGDRLNRLHWPAFARTGELVVRDFVEPVVPRVEIVVDVRSAAIEASVREAAAAGVAALATGRSVDLRTTAGERLEIAPVQGRLVFLQALAALAPLPRRRR
ncbi:MAG: DUF58 domain-containing protein [Acidimicrobiales bacterium]